MVLPGVTLLLPPLPQRHLVWANLILDPQLAIIGLIEEDRLEHMIVEGGRLGVTRFAFGGRGRMSI